MSVYGSSEEDMPDLSDAPIQHERPSRDPPRPSRPRRYVVPVSVDHKVVSRTTLPENTIADDKETDPKNEVKAEVAAEGESKNLVESLPVVTSSSTTITKNLRSSSVPDDATPDVVKNHKNRAL